MSGLAQLRHRARHARFVPRDPDHTPLSDYATLLLQSLEGWEPPEATFYVEAEQDEIPFGDRYNAFLLDRDENQLLTFSFNGDNFAQDRAHVLQQLVPCDPSEHELVPIAQYQAYWEARGE
ncbi:MAG TPA: hypothetical protein VEC14_02760 [Reyranellaceae bacterium]|nr:hypothetical protein [Reyranellaceae bacterium]